MTVFPEIVAEVCNNPTHKVSFPVALSDNSISIASGNCHQENTKLAFSAVVDKNTFDSVAFLTTGTSQQVLNAPLYAEQPDNSIFSRIPYDGGNDVKQNSVKKRHI
jgi:hypothetical protein